MTEQGCFSPTIDFDNPRYSRFLLLFNSCEPSSPDMFESDIEEPQREEPEPSPIKLSCEELISRSDSFVHKQITKYLSGVPPPPKITTCPYSCSEMLELIKQNKDYFWTNNEKSSTAEKIVDRNENSNDSAYPNNESLNTNHSNDNSAILNFDEQSKDSAIILENNSGTSTSLLSSDANKSKEYTEKDLNESILLKYHSITPQDALNMSFEEAFKHKTFGIHYNRNKAVEEFERLTVRLSDRYINKDSESTCNIWFTMSAAESRLHALNLSEKVKGSPGKRLNYLTKRRRTFSRANLQSLAAMDKKHRLVQYKKSVIRKGKSPRGKSPRRKSPRVKTPRSSTKKNSIKRLSLDNISPLKTKLAFPRRALFQSPPADRTNPSQTLFSSNANPHTIKRALFTSSEEEKHMCTSESKKRKNDEPLDGPCLKWPRTLDCTKSVDENSPKTRERSSTDMKIENNNSTVSGNKSMSSTHRKKLLWAVAEALRAKGIGMGDPRFKQYASSLARIVKKYMPDLENRYLPRKPGSTTDRMLKIAKSYVYLIMEGKFLT